MQNSEKNKIKYVLIIEKCKLRKALQQKMNDSKNT